MDDVRAHLSKEQQDKLDVFCAELVKSKRHIGQFVRAYRPDEPRAPGEVDYYSFVKGGEVVQVMRLVGDAAALFILT